MIDQTAYKQILAQHPALGSLDDKTAEIARDALEPGELITMATSVQIDGKPGVIVLTDHRVLAFWKMTLFFFFKFPTIQEFHLSQLTELQTDGSKLRLRAVANPDDEDEGWEDNTFLCSSPTDASAFEAAVNVARG